MQIFQYNQKIQGQAEVDKIPRKIQKKEEHEKICSQR